MTIYDVFKKENYLEILKIANKFNLSDKKRKKKTKIIVLENFKNKSGKIDEIQNQEIFNGLLFENFSIEDIRKNLDKITFITDNEELNEITKHNEIDVVITDKIMDSVIFKNMNENFISIAFDFSEILNSRGIQRVKKLGIMKKNFQMAKKYETNYIISTFAGNIFEYKPSEALIAFGKTIGMSDEESRSAVSENYEKIIKKFNDRNDESLLTNGLRVIKFGSIKKEKKRYGYY